MAEALKNTFDEKYVELVATIGSNHVEGFSAGAFEQAVGAELGKLELKDRINLIADELRAQLPTNFADGLESLVAMARAITSSTLTQTAAWGSGLAWPMCSVVERHGIDDPKASLDAMESLTQTFSCEFAIRPFLENHLERTIARCHEWTRHSHPAVRRLPSEGTRPFLPWGPKVRALLDNPDIGIGLISALRHDSDEVVRRSVANHLNDIARNHPDRAAEIASSWLAESQTDASMVRHALRGLVKKGHPAAMNALGFTTEADVEITRFSVQPNRIRLGEAIRLEADIASNAAEDQKLVVDFIVHHVGARGETSPKVFKWTTINLAPNSRSRIEKRRLIQTASTRRYYAGRHRVELQIAGQVVAETDFELVESSH